MVGSSSGGFMLGVFCIVNYGKRSSGRGLLHSFLYRRLLGEEVQEEGDGNYCSLIQRFADDGKRSEVLQHERSGRFVFGPEACFFLRSFFLCFFLSFVADRTLFKAGGFFEVENANIRSSLDAPCLAGFRLQKSCIQRAP